LLAARSLALTHSHHHDGTVVTVPAVAVTAPAVPVEVRRSAWIPVSVGILLGALLLGAMVGPAGPTWWRVPLALLDHLPLISVDSGVSDAEWNVIWQIRMPRVLLAGIVGAMLSLAGASYQGVFRNPLVDPYLLGAAAGAGLGATIVFTVARSATEDWPVDPAPTVAFVAASATVLVTYTVGAAFGGTRSAVTLVLAGVAVTSLVTAVQTFILQRHSEVVRQVYSWILGSLSTARWSDVRMVVPYVTAATVVLLLHRRHLDLLRVGDDEASSLGEPVARMRVAVVIAATLGTAAVVAVSGLIGFVGIVVPHLIRLLTGASYYRVLPLSVLLGAAFLILADIPGRVLTDPAETPIGVVTAFIGAPFFLVVLRARQGVR
jgi:iron complex transport system permease protein